MRWFLAQNGLGARAAALITYSARLGSTGRVAEMMTHLAAQRSFDQSLLQGQRRGIYRFGRH